MDIALSSCSTPYQAPAIRRVFQIFYQTVLQKQFPGQSLYLRLIQKIRISQEKESDPYVALIKRLAVNEKLDFDTAKILITEYRKIRKEE